MSQILMPAQRGRILYMTDRYGVSQGYEPAFTKMLNRAGITRQSVLLSNIYGLVEQPLYKKANEKLWRFNPEKLPEIERAFSQRVRTIKPSLIVVSDPAVLGVIVKGDSRVGTLEKCRGGVYEYEGIPVVVTYPITVIHTHVDERLLEGADVENREQPYRVPSGAWIINRDWQKVGRIYLGKQDRLPGFKYSVCRTVTDCYAARDFCRDSIALAIDIETGCHPPQITCVGITAYHKTGAVRTFVIPFYDPTEDSGCYWDIDDHVIAVSIVAEINRFDNIKFMQNGSYDCSYFIRDLMPPKNFLVDTMLLWWSLYMELPKSLDFISSILLDQFQYWKDDIKGIEDKDLTSLGMEKYWRYNALDCYNTMFCGIKLLQVMQTSPAMQHNYNDALMRLFAGLGMSMRGVKADFRRRFEHEEALTAQRDTAVERLRYLIADPEFNHNSPQQKVSLLYDMLGATPRNARGRFIDKNKPLKGTNAPSAGALPLKLIKSEHPVFARIVTALQDAMEPDKQISNVCKMFLATDRFRTAFSPVGTETTRFSSKASNFWDGGNAQNIRKEFRDWMVADSGCVLMEIDFSQSDDVFMAYEANDPDKIEVIQSGRDGHAVNGELFFKVGYDRIVAGKKAKEEYIVHPTKGIRQLSKRIVHGTNFQMAAVTLYITMGREAVVAAAELLGFHDASKWDQARLVQLCEVLMATYRRKYKRLTKNEYYREVADSLRRTGTMTNAFGITRRFIGNPEDNGTQREATAFIGQSDTAGNMNRSMNEIVHGYMPKRFRDGENPHWGDKPLKMDWQSHGLQFLLQVHDSFLIQLNLRNPKWMEAAGNILRVMERPVIINGHSVRVKTEAEFSTRWGKDTIEWKGSFDELESIASTLTRRK